MFNIKFTNFFAFLFFIITFSDLSYAKNLYLFTVSDDDLKGNFLYVENSSKPYYVDLLFRNNSEKIDVASYSDLSDDERLTIFPNNSSWENQLFGLSPVIIGGSGKIFQTIQTLTIDFSIFPLASHLESVTLPWSYTSGNYINGISGDMVRGPIPPFSVQRASNFSFSKIAEFQDVNPVPEPETYFMMLLGLGLLGFVARRKQA